MGLRTLRLLKARRDLDAKGEFAPIVMVDNGSHLRHPQLAGVIHKYRSAKEPHQGSIADHSSSVAAIIGARRGAHGAESGAMDGCCSAEIEMYNVWTTTDGSTIICCIEGSCMRSGIGGQSST